MGLVLLFKKKKKKTVKHVLSFSFTLPPSLPLSLPCYYLLRNVWHTRPSMAMPRHPRGGPPSGPAKMKHHRQTGLGSPHLRAAAGATWSASLEPGWLGDHPSPP